MKTQTGLGKVLNIFSESGIDGVSRIRFSNGEIGLIDTEDVNRVKELTWSCFNNRGNKYAQHATVKNNHLLLHRFILKAPTGSIVDHANRNGLDNRKCNLRLCTNGQNQCNRPGKNRTSKYKGVHKHKTSDYWVAQISSNNKKIYLGFFKAEEDAAKAYNMAAKKYQGQFAYLNEVTI